MTDLIRLNPTRWPYSLTQLRLDEPSRSFSYNPSDIDLAFYDVFRVLPQPQPDHDATTHRVEETQPIEHEGQWLQQWQLVALTADEKQAQYRATHPPQWVAFGDALIADPHIDAMVGKALQTAPSLAMALGVGLGRAVDGDSRVFLSAWNAANASGLITDELKTAIIAAAGAHDLPAEFIAGLG